MVPRPREKKLERKRKNLIRLGVNQGMAYAWSRTRTEASVERLGSSPKPDSTNHHYREAPNKKRVRKSGELLWKSEDLN